MRILQKVKDGGSESTVDAYFLFEIKGLCSVAVLKFNKGSRTNYHSHAFNALTWFIKGKMVEHDISGTHKDYNKSFLPKLTKRNNFHKVVAEKTSWCLTIRGPWVKNWKEYNPQLNESYLLSNGRKILNKWKGI